MSKFGKFLGNTEGKSSQGALVSTDRSSRATDIIARAERAASDPTTAKKIIGGSVAKVAIALDATGSMAGLLNRAKQSIGEIIRRTSAEAGRPVEIEIFVYRDYDVPNDLRQRSGVSGAPDALSGWLSRISANGGGANGGEAVEAALQLIVDEGDFSVVLLAGDEPSNGPAELRAAGKSRQKTARDLAALLGAAKTPVHSFVIGDDNRAITDFAAIAKASGGATGRLDGSAEMIDLAVMAILSTIRGSGAVKSYRETHRLSSNAETFAQTLLAAPK